MKYLPMFLTIPGEEIAMSERASTAGTVTLMGMLTIFAVLAILWAMIEILHSVLHKGEKKEKEPRPKKTAPAPAPNQDDAAIAAAIAAALAAAEDDGAVVAAITAAITAARAEAGETGAFRVVSFKRAERKRGARR
ncbi:MAG: OadG family protein [Clostridia bacterium]|nr:OadG family protein [Clostridia bacterium]